MTSSSHLTRAFFDSEAKEDWGEVQVRGTANWGGPLWCFFFGGINYQIEHHLFPTIYPGYYPLIAPVVRDACLHHGVPYNHFSSITEALLSVFANFATKVA